MSEFIFGRDSNTKTEYLLKKIREEQSAGRRAIIIIPEQQALYWDTLSAQNLEKKHLMNTEIVSFTRLADSVFRTFGGCAKRYITDAEKTLVMWNALESVWDKLSFFSGSGEKYVSGLRHAVSELKMYSVTPEAIATAGEELCRLGEDTLGVRLSELSLIYAAYESLLHNAYDDPEEIPDALAEVLDSHNYFEGCSVFIDSFHTLTPKQMKVLHRIFHLCDKVYITFSMDSGDRELEEYKYVWSYVKATSRLASQCGHKIESVHIPTKKSEAITYLSEHIWDYGAKAYDGEADVISTVYCGDKHDEALLCAAKIKDIVSRGASFSQIAVVAANMEERAGIIDRELERCNIPVYLSGRTPCTSQPAVKLLLSACRFCAGGWKGEALVKIAKSGLCGLSADMCDAMERYIEIWNLHGKNAITNDSMWQMNPDGYSERISSRGAEMLRLAGEAKDILIPPLEAFSESFGKSAREICAAAYKLLCDFDVYGRLCRECSALEAGGDGEGAQRVSQVWGAICSLLETVATVVDDTPMDAKTFLALFSKVAKTVSIGAIPPSLDRVTLGSASSVRLDGIQHLIVLGAGAGEFPATPSEGGFFSDGDKERLATLGIELSPGREESLCEELFRFAHTVTAPISSLTLFVTASEDGEVHPSLGVLRCHALFPNSKITDFSTAEGVEQVRRINAEIYKKTPLDIPLDADSDRISRDAVDALFPEKLSMTQSKIETFNDCAFKFYCRYILKLDEGEIASVNAGDVGTFVHKILEDFMRYATERNVFPVEEGIILSQSERLIKNYIAEVCPENISGRVDYMFRRLRRSVNMYIKSLSDEFAQSRFRPVSFEERIGDGGELPSMPIALSGGKTMSISGVVDRIDTYKNGDKVYVRVADYKTGSKDFKLEDVMQGINVQLLLYLFSICQSPAECGFRKKTAPMGEKLVPAGAVYFSSVVGSTASDTPLESGEASELMVKDIKRRGIVCDDMDIIRAMDSDLSGVYAPARLTAKGEFDRRSCVADSEGFEEIRLAMTEALSKMGDSILEGKACSVPSTGESVCKNCAMNAICRHNNMAPKAVEGGEGDNE